MSSATSETSETGASPDPGRERRPPEVRMVPIGKITVDPEIQRGYRRTQAENIARNFDPHALGVLTLSDREDGGPFRAVDGQHRLQAMGILDYDPSYEVVCKVCYGLSPQEEARLFRLLNNTRRPNSLDLFRIAVVEGEPVATDIQDVLNRAGWKVGVGPRGTGLFMAVGAARDVYNLAARRNNNESGWGKTAFERVMLILTKAWRLTTVSSVDALMVKGLGYVLVMNWDMDDDLMVEKLAVHPGAARGVLAQVEGKATAGTTKLEAMVGHLIDYYNEGQPVKRRLIKLGIKSFNKPR